MLCFRTNCPFKSDNRKARQAGRPRGLLKLLSCVISVFVLVASERLVLDLTVDTILGYVGRVYKEFIVCMQC